MEPTSENGLGTILFVDDDTDLLSIMTAFGEAWGFRCVAIADSRQAMQAALDEKPDIIVTDVVMPYMDGFELFRLIREEPRTTDIPVIFLSAGKVDVSSKVQGLEMGACDYLIKPVDPVEMRARIKGHMDRYRRMSATGQGRDLEVVQRTAVFLNHSINNLLCTIQLAADLMKEEGDDDVIRRSELIARNVAQIRDVIAKLKQIKRVVVTSYVGEQGMLDLELSIADASEDPSAPVKPLEKGQDP